MTGRYYAQVPVPPNVTAFIVRRRDRVLERLKMDTGRYYMENIISQYLHWTIKAPFTINDTQIYNDFIEMLHGEASKLKTRNIIIKGLCLPFGDWTEPVIYSPGTLPQMKTIALSVKFPHDQKGTLGNLQNEITRDENSFYTYKEQFNQPHITLINKLQETPIHKARILYDALLDEFDPFELSFEVNHIHVLKKIGTDSWIIDQKIPIPYY